MKPSSSSGSQHSLIRMSTSSLSNFSPGILFNPLIHWWCIDPASGNISAISKVRDVHCCPPAHTRHLMSTFWTLLDDCQPSPPSRTNILILMPSAFWKKVPHLVFSLQYWQNPSPPKKLKYYTKIQMLSLILNLDCIFSKNRMTNTIRIYE